MRTTLSIRDDLYDAARQRAFEERRTLGDVVNELIERGLAPERGSNQRRLGALAGQVSIAADFDADLGDMTDALAEPADLPAGPPAGL